MKNNDGELSGAGGSAGPGRKGKDEEILLLKKTVKALSVMVLHYRIGQSAMPEWVFDNIGDAKRRYGEDLTKII